MRVTVSRKAHFNAAHRLHVGSHADKRAISLKKNFGKEVSTYFDSKYLSSCFYQICHISGPDGSACQNNA